MLTASKNTWCAIVALLGGLCVGACLKLAPQAPPEYEKPAKRAEPASTEFTFDLKSMPLSEAMVAVTNQTGYSVMADAAEISDHIDHLTHSVEGHMEIGQALSIWLADTGVRAHLTGHVIILKADRQAEGLVMRADQR